MKKIVFFSGGIHRTGGTERVLSVIANNLSKRDYEVTIVSLCGKECYYPLEQDIRVIYLNSKSLSSSIPSNLKKLSNIIKDIHPDYWVDVDYILGVYTKRIRNKYNGMKWISWEHFCYYYEYPRYRKLRKRLQKYVCKKSDCFLVLSKEDEKDYNDNLRIKAKLKQIYNPVPCEVKEFNPEREKIVLAAGRLTKIKGFDILLDAWSIIENDYPEWKLIIAGEGEEKNNLLKKIEDSNLKKVEITGFVEDMESLYKKTSVFALSSRNEGFPMVLLETMAYGIPSVAFDCKCGIKEIINDNENGFIVKNGDYQEFAKKLILLMSNSELLDRMSKDTWNKAGKFNEEKIILEWTEMLESI